MTSTRDRVGQFDAVLPDVELVRVVGRVAQRALPDDPRSLSQPVFDRFVAAHRDEFAGVPTARAIYMRVNSGNQGRVAWPQIVAAGVQGEAAARQTVVAGTRSVADVAIDDHVVFFALNLVHDCHDPDAGPFGEQVYEAIRERLIGRGRRRNRELERILPNAAQITQRVREGWPAALHIAGLAAPELHEPQRVDGPAADASEHDETRDVKAPPSRSRATQPASRAMARADAIALFLEHHGRLPVQSELKQFAKLSRFRLAHHIRPWGDEIAAARNRWNELGRWWPPGLAHKDQRDAVVAASGEYAEHPQRGTWDDIDVCAQALNLYWDTLTGRREPTQKGYGRWATGKPYPAPRNFARHGGFGAVKERARQLRHGR